MIPTRVVCAVAVTFLVGATTPVTASEPCPTAGPQSGRDVGNAAGTNSISFAKAPPAATMNLCNIHFHRSAEHKAKGYSTSAGAGDHGGWACNGTEPRMGGEEESHGAEMSHGEMSHGKAGTPGCKGIEAGDTVEVHWVYTTCDTGPGNGLGNCVSCPEEGRSLRVEARVFQLEKKGLNFKRFDYRPGSSPAQPRSLPKAFDPVTYAGSTTGTSFDDKTCSPFEVTWNVSTECSPLKISTLHKWCGLGDEINNVFGEKKAHGVRALVTNPEYLSPIEGD
ncbi:MAG: cadmium carbonic anhydrase [Deltaproteobacteria bacterium]|nr:cadmium carbonic anhydrase [Deltaproteobacteria bacterium]